ncbi:protein of unknown function [Ralstonia solanacearum CMR15]|nr:protein of unknown function [Ralstonia solanacearum CMR15]
MGYPTDWRGGRLFRLRKLAFLDIFPRHMMGLGTGTPTKQTTMPNPHDVASARLQSPLGCC